MKSRLQLIVFLQFIAPLTVQFFGGSSPVVRNFVLFSDLYCTNKNLYELCKDIIKPLPLPYCAETQKAVVDAGSCTVNNSSNYRPAFRHYFVSCPTVSFSLFIYLCSVRLSNCVAFVICCCKVVENIQYLWVWR